MKGDTIPLETIAMKLILLLLIILTCLGLWEMARHSWHCRRIPIRVHVNGSRGKSSVARLIAAGLRGGGVATFAKTTGSAAAVIHVDGSETPIRRRGGPNIREQLAIIRQAVRENCEALVIECMAVRPDLQKICEHKIVRATHGVLTNVRPDHLEVMGPTMDDVAASLGNTIPRKAKFFTAEPDFSAYFKKRTFDLGSTYVRSDADDVSAQELQGFAYVEFAENVSLALATCEAAGVPREQALEGMYKVRPDVGALTRWYYREQDKEIEFVNAFAANDPVSYIKVWDRLGLLERDDETIVLMNIRADRQRRSKDLAPLFGRELPAAYYVLIGEQTGIIADMLRRQKLDDKLIVDLGGQSAAAIWDKLVEIAPPRATVVGIGNIANVGNDLLALLRAKETDR